MHSAERLTLRDARQQAPWPLDDAARSPPRMPVAAGGLSGRPRCRIFPIGRVWVLQLETPSAWLIGDGPYEAPPRLKFPTLAAAIAHAEWYGYDYRIITPSPVARLADRRMASHGNRPDTPRAGQSNTEH